MKFTLLVGATTAFTLSPLRQSRPVLVSMRPAPLASSLVDELTDTVVPDDTKASLRNAVGYQAVGWGLGGLLIPTKMMSVCYGAVATGGNLALLRGLSVTNLVLGTKICKGSDKEAAATGFLFFAGWTMFLKKALAAGTFAGQTSTIITWNMVMAIVAARRQGGLWATAKSLDTDAVSSVTPTKASFDDVTAPKNLIGLQLFGWGVIASFFPSFLFGSNMLGMKADGIATVSAQGIGMANLLLSGKVLSGSDKNAAATGAVTLGTWAVLGYLGKASGAFAGKYTGLTALWNAAMVAYCVKSLLD